MEGKANTNSFVEVKATRSPGNNIAKERNAKPIIPAVEKLIFAQKTIKGSPSWK
jgi:hypothetical protein